MKPSQVHPSVFAGPIFPLYISSPFVFTQILSSLGFHWDFFSVVMEDGLLVCEILEMGCKRGVPVPVTKSDFACLLHNRIQSVDNVLGQEKPLYTESH